MNNSKLNYWTREDDGFMDEWIKDNCDVYVDYRLAHKQLIELFPNRSPGALYSRWRIRRAAMGITSTPKKEATGDAVPVFSPNTSGLKQKEAIATLLNGVNDFNKMKSENEQLRQKIMHVENKLRSMREVALAAEQLYSVIQKYRRQNNSNI